MNIFLLLKLDTTSIDITRKYFIYLFIYSNFYISILNRILHAILSSDTLLNEKKLRATSSFIDLWILCSSSTCLSLSIADIAGVALSVFRKAVFSSL